MRVDLHCHSVHSDGMLTPHQLLHGAQENNIKIFSITDHDSIDAYANLTLQDDKIKLITGIEFSTTWNNMGVHIVGLNFDRHCKGLLESITYQKNARIQRAKEISKKLEKFGLYEAFETLSEKASDQIGRPDFAQLLVDKGICKDCNHAFKKFLGAGKIGDVKNHWLAMESVIKSIRNAGGIAVLAHPLKYKLTRTKWTSGGIRTETYGFESTSFLNYKTH